MGGRSWIGRAHPDGTEPTTPPPTTDDTDERPRWWWVLRRPSVTMAHYYRLNELAQELRNAAEDVAALEHEGDPDLTHSTRIGAIADELEDMSHG